MIIFEIHKYKYIYIYIYLCVNIFGVLCPIYVTYLEHTVRLLGVVGVVVAQAHTNTKWT